MGVQLKETAESQAPQLCHSPAPRVLLLSHSGRVRLSATPWTAACQASLSITISWSLLKLTSVGLDGSFHL